MHDDATTIYFSGSSMYKFFNPHFIGTDSLGIRMEENPLSYNKASSPCIITILCTAIFQSVYADEIINISVLRMMLSAAIWRFLDPYVHSEQNCPPIFILKISLWFMMSVKWSDKTVVKKMKITFYAVSQNGKDICWCMLGDFQNRKCAQQRVNWSKEL